ncbi:hypothetical protein KGQ20_25435 [Catenulispora sp. NF23]|uniref:hypothetical protein n=1 Tax=Catenulispora pinistramenti TaxID=2705254 RepID=UPI001BA95784|nr:hypothetical protein [Catenulispora pinistramenti]MBS2536110.1 hypothetical protein [Catenulispora pinistramenti]
MTEYEAENVRTLFQDADLDDVPTTRDLIGPAVAWGSGRRRRDRWTALGVTGAVAAVAVAGVVALRPGGEGGPKAVGPGVSVQNQSTAKPSPVKPIAPALIATRQQELLDSLRPYLPAGDRITCQSMNQMNGFCQLLTFTSPTGTSTAQWNAYNQFYEDGPADTKYEHEHTATAAIPLVSGTIDAPGGNIRIQSTDAEAQINVSEKQSLTDPAALTFHTAQYVFTPTGATDPAKSVVLEQTELVREMPWKGKPQVADAHGLWGFNPTGPVLSPEQFAKLVTAPIFPSVFQQLAALQAQADREGIQQQSSSSH